MKIVMAIIKPFKLDEVREALTGLGVQGLTVTEVKGYGRQKGHTEIYRGAEYAVSFLPKIKIKIEVAVAADHRSTAAIDAIAACAPPRPGQIGDGKIFVMRLDDAPVRIRTGETDTDALGSIMVGKRTGYGKDNMAPHSMTLTMVGASILWVGWFGFNAGSNLEATSGAALAMINTFVATAGAIIAWVVIEALIRGKASMLGAASGVVAGLVAITPACGSVGPVGAIVLGAVASAVCYYFVAVVKIKMGYDDSLDVFGIHGIGGIVGALGTGILTAPWLGGTGGDDFSIGSQLWIQFVAVLVTVVWCGVISAILFKIVDVVIGLRPTEEAERQGLDLTSHGEVAYHS
jgi:nitrogen regulatory protein PII